MITIGSSRRARTAARLLFSVIASIGAATLAFSALIPDVDGLKFFVIVCTVVIIVFGAPLGVWLGRVTADRTWPMALLIHAAVGATLGTLATGFIGLLFWGTPFGAIAAVAGGAVYRATAPWAAPSGSASTPRSSGSRPTPS